MILSHKHKFLFIENPKTASTSINNFLRVNVEDALFIRTPSKKHQNSSRHCNLENALLDFKEAFKYFKFCFVRNPWDIVVSWFFFYKKNGKIDDSLIFEDFVKGVTLRKTYFGIINDPRGFNFIGKFENLNNDFNFICQKIGIKFKELPHENEHKHKYKHYTEYYNNNTRQIIAEKFSKNIEYFGYKFGA